MLTQHRNPLLRAESLEELCSWSGADFIRCAYVTILGRQPDVAGQAYYFDRLHRGLSKLTLIAQLRRSPEGRHHDPGIAGMDKALRKHRNACLPLVGPIIRLITGRTGNSFRERQSRALVELAASIERLSLQQSAGDRRLDDGLKELQSISTDLATSLKHVLQQQRESDEKFGELVGVTAHLTGSLKDLSQHLTVRDSELRQHVGEFIRSAEDRIGSVEGRVSELAESDRSLIEQTQNLRSEVENLGSHVQKIDDRINEVQSSSQKVRGLLLKANSRAFG